MSNGNSLWQDAIEKEMKNIRPALEVWENDEDNMIFDIKLGENFRRKARYVAGGHTTDLQHHLHTRQW